MYDQKTTTVVQLAKLFSTNSYSWAYTIITLTWILNKLSKNASFLPAGLRKEKINKLLWSSEINIIGIKFVVMQSEVS